MTFFQLIFKNLTPQTRSLLTAAGLAAAVAATTTLLNIAWAFAGSAANAYQGATSTSSSSARGWPNASPAA